MNSRFGESSLKIQVILTTLSFGERLEKIQELNTSRKQYIQKQNKAEANGLENAMIKAIKTQAKHKNYKWE